MTEVADEKRLYKIGEVCRVADVQPYVLRYWETEFAALAPNKSGGGQRLYTQREIDIILRIKQLLYSEGFTIAGAKKKLETELAGRGATPMPVEADALSDAPAPPSNTPAAAPAANDHAVQAMREVRTQLREILTLLDRSDKNRG